MGIHTYMIHELGAYTCVCMYVCVDGYAYVYDIHVPMYMMICTSRQKYIVHVCMYVCMYAWIHVLEISKTLTANVCVCVCVYVCMYVWIHVPEISNTPSPQTTRILNKCSTHKDTCTYM